jgi:hypothetical protein
MSEKGQSRKSMFSALKNMEELRRLYDSDTPVLAYAFKRLMVEGWVMLGMTVPWTLGRMLPEWPAVLSCVRFWLRPACHLAVGDSRRGCLLPLRCWPKENLSRRPLSQSGTTA